jgi:hypothetical protein
VAGRRPGYTGYRRHGRMAPGMARRCSLSLRSLEGCDFDSRGADVECLLRKDVTRQTPRSYAMAILKMTVVGRRTCDSKRDSIAPAIAGGAAHRYRE